MRNDTLEIQCIFLDYLMESSKDNSILSAGQWSDRGCSKSESLSSTSVTVCECNHLTHFSILLSAQPTATDLDKTYTTDSTTLIKRAGEVLKEEEADTLNSVSIHNTCNMLQFTLSLQILSDSDLRSIFEAVSILFIIK